MGLAEGDHSPHKGVEVALVARPRIVEPVRNRVNVVGVVVAAETAQIFVSARHQRRAGAQHHEGEAYACGGALVDRGTTLVPAEVCRAAAVRGTIGPGLVVVGTVASIQV